MDKEQIDLVTEYLDDEELKKNIRRGYGHKIRQVTPGRQGHWRPRQLQVQRLRRKTKPGRAPRRMPTGRRRRRALLASLRHSDSLIGKYNPNHDKSSGKFSSGSGGGAGSIKVTRTSSGYGAEGNGMRTKNARYRTAGLARQAIEMGRKHEVERIPTPKARKAGKKAAAKKRSGGGVTRLTPEQRVANFRREEAKQARAARKRAVKEGRLDPGAVTRSGRRNRNFVMYD